MKIKAQGIIIRGKFLGSAHEFTRNTRSPRWTKLVPPICIGILVLGLTVLAIFEISVVTSGTTKKPSTKEHYNTKNMPVIKNKLIKDSSFKLEPLIRRNAATVELSAQVILNNVRSDILKEYLNKESDYNIVNKKNEKVCSPVKKDCPIVPPHLKGHMDVNSTEFLDFRVNLGGWYKPKDCISRHVIAIIIPFRDRHSQLEILMKYLHPILQRQQLNYRIFVIEQAGNDIFNKGILMNAGFLIALKNPLYEGLIYHCMIFHDVDMLLEDDRNIYTCPQQPRHMSVAVNELDYRLPYRELVGGVFAIRSDHFLRVNGYSNLYWGWGGEDDDMGYRVEHVLFSISRPPEWIARYSMIKHEKRRPLAAKIRSKLTRTSWRRFRFDGLNTLKYKLISINNLELYTHVLIDVGEPPKSIKQIQDAEDKQKVPK